MTALQTLSIPTVEEAYSQFYFTYLPFNLRHLDLTRVALNRITAIFLLRYLERPHSLDQIGFHVSESDPTIADEILSDILGVLGKTSVTKIGLSGVQIGELGCSGLIKYIKEAKFLPHIVLNFTRINDDCRVIDRMLSALSTRSDSEFVAIFLEGDKVSISRLKTFFQKTYKTLVNFMMISRNLKTIDSNQAGIISAVEKNTHLRKLLFGASFNASILNVEGNRLVIRSTAYDTEIRTDLAPLFGHLRYLVGSRYKKACKIRIPFNVVIQILITTIHSFSNLGYWHGWSFKDITKCLLDRRTIGKIQLEKVGCKRFADEHRCVNCDLATVCIAASRLVEEAGSA